MKYHVKWIEPNGELRGNLGKEVVEELNLGAFIMSLTNDRCIIIQVEPI